MRHVLFVCSQNRLRSPTAAVMYNETKDIEACSAGLDADAIVTVTDELIDWATIIFVMERQHEYKLKKRFKQQMVGKKIISLHISDVYEYMDPALIDMINTKVSRCLGRAPDVEA